MGLWSFVVAAVGRPGRRPYRNRDERCGPSGEQVEIAFGDQRAVVVEVGGGLRTYAVGGARSSTATAPTRCCRSGRGQVLIPWPNRIEDGSYEFDGRRHQLPIDEPENGTRSTASSAGRVDRRRERAPAVVVEHLLHPQPGYPFSLALRIEYALCDGRPVGPTTATNVG